MNKHPLLLLSFILSFVFVSLAHSSTLYDYEEVDLDPIVGNAAVKVDQDPKVSPVFNKRIVMMSDLHNNVHKVGNYLMGRKKNLDNLANSVAALPAGDFLIVAGDFTHLGKKSEVKEFLKFIIEANKQNKFTHILIVAGNHEVTFDNNRFQHSGKRRALIQLRTGFDFLGKSSPIKQYFIDHLPDNAHYLEDETITLEGIKFYGSPWINVGGTFGFRPIDTDEISKKDFLMDRWAHIPDDTNVLITHTPPKNIGDGGGYHSCKYLKQRVDQLEDLNLHVFGHHHYAYGAEKRTSEDGHQTYFINSAITLDDQNFNHPIVIDL